MNSKNALVLVLGVLVGVLGTMGVYMLTEDEEVEETEEVVEEEQQILALPEDPEAQDLGGCYVGAGQHHMNPALFGEGDNLVGPTYLYNPDTGEVIGTEYHFTMDYLEEQGEVYADTIYEELGGDIDLFGASYDHMTLHYTEGHEGFEEPHFDVHLFTISFEERMEIDCE